MSTGMAGSRENTGFFLQAEDGIRDRTVTGVQTCALPILQREAITASRPSHFHSHRKRVCARGRTGVCRSEERRVGKEWRSRCAPDHKNKQERIPSHDELREIRPVPDIRLEELIVSVVDYN